MSASRTANPTITLANLDDLLLRDIGVGDDGGSIVDEGDPRFRRITRPAAVIDRLLALINLPVAGMLFRA